MLFCRCRGFAHQAVDVPGAVEVGDDGAETILRDVRPRQFKLNVAHVVVVGRRQRKNGALAGQRSGGGGGDPQVGIHHQGHGILQSQIHLTSLPDHDGRRQITPDEAI